MATEVRVSVIPNCDVCKLNNWPAKPAAYDGKTVHGPWAYMCEDCWQLVGIGRLGTGYGQRLILE